MILRRTFLATLAGLPAVALPQDSPPASVGVVRDGEDRLREHHTIGVSTTAFKVLTKETAGSLFVIENRMTKKGGPPRHLHHGQDEWFFVVRGDFVMEIGADRFRLSPGDSILGPREIPHAYAYVGDGPGQLLIAYTPANRIEEFFRGRTEGARYSTDAERYRAFGLELLGPPIAIEP